jgi:uncharacterized protein with HEPN domain
LSGFRNVLVHDYLGVNLRTIWRIIETDAPGLKRELVELAARIKAERGREPV